MSTFRTGVIDATVNSRVTPDLFIRNTQAVAKSAGADSIWVADHLMSLIPRSVWSPKYAGAAKLAPRVDAYYEPWITLGYFAARNRLSRMRLGTAVTDTARRNPAVTAQAAATLHLLSRGRAILGIGTGEREGNEPYGVDWRRPVARFEEAMATIRALWDSKGQPVNRDSDFFPLRNAIFDLPQHHGTWPEIWVAAHGPRMLRATGKYADAWFPVATMQASEYGTMLDSVRAAASDAGRDPAKIIPAGVFFSLTGTTRADVDELVGSIVVRAFALNLPAKEWVRHGAVHPMGDSFTGFQDMLPQTFDEATVLDYVERVPESLVREHFLTGTPSEIVDQVAVWRDSGLRYAVVGDLGAFHPRLRKGLGTALPTIRALRGMRKL
ncbi:LLM class flavin-dependent oxidoreductase [Williamsia sp. 1135]|uniref:LLM class flavin-dependent oxidoreductase n=1 Tax=Williamsia sp. 1135 TaxID=1889262 RepID=UPI000A0FE241|nr:LLM class flavin-dependent oxidoreductase [Williamsia sp. 1135]ORM38266.1 monooxygenase [Williamsia sp. 1135]